MLQLNECPICNSNQFEPFLECKDYTVSRETFQIVSCLTCQFKFTNPIPDLDKLGSYYKSEEYVSHSNSNKGFINSVYQFVRKYTLLKKLKLISKFNKTGNILDIGCGTGEFLNICKQAKWNVMGIEPDEGARKMASDNFSLHVKPEAELKNLPDQSFDIITMWHVLEHVPKLKDRVQELKRLLKPKGVIIIAVPNCSSLDAKKYKQYWAAYDVPRHLYHFTPGDLNALTKQFDLTVFNTLPMVFDSFYVSMLSEKYKKGKLNLICSMWNGFQSNLNAAKTGKNYSSQIYLIRKNK
ncbi:MAG TPA: class I SAM-dependent methyltransferase [Bacteroidia bacterium]|jgi:2-polyprenyl-3-methyl-5-hydroxy-6-metoxy-1,4-benzoquinol methylase|nr:class I SAM-dependent methyltransferase [Bacteroidia bacterium]